MSIHLSALATYVQPEGSDKANIGSSFIVKNATHNYFLVTAAHLPTNAQPTSDFSKWPEYITVLNAVNSGVRFNLFNYVAETRIPTFKHILADGGRVADIMALPLAPHFVLPRGTFENRYIVDLLQPVTATRGPGKIIGFGYPDRGGTWPYNPADEIHGEFLHLNQSMYEGKLQTCVGHSGGPVFDHTEQFVGMMIGETNGLARIVPDFVISALCDGRITTSTPPP